MYDIENIEKYVVSVSPAGTIIERSDWLYRSQARVFNTITGKRIKTFRFDSRFNKEISSRYLSWDNLNACGEWMYDRDYLLTAVQRDKKLCAEIPFDTREELYAYVKAHGSNLPHLIMERDFLGGTKCYCIIAKPGRITDYIRMADIRDFYEGATKFDIKFWKLEKLCRKEIISLVEDTSWNYLKPQTPEDYIIMGLMMGYPPESTLAIITDNKPINARFPERKRKRRNPRAAGPVKARSTSKPKKIMAAKIEAPAKPKPVGRKKEKV